MKPTIKIDIISDVVCPWCYLGEAKLDRAIEANAETYHFEINFKPFQLNPEMTTEGVNRMAYMAGKFGGEERVKQMDEGMKKNAAAVGLVYNPEFIKISPNTFNAHRLIWLAHQFNVQKAVAEDLHKNHFADGKSVGDISTLIETGSKSGIPESKLVAFFESNEGTKEVQELEKQYRNSGVSSVPTYIVNEEYMVNGAQSSEDFTNLFKKISPTFKAILPEGKTCDDDICEIN